VNRSAGSGNRILLVVYIAASLALAAFALASSPVSVARVGTLVEAAQMREPRSGHSATLLPDGKVLIAGGMRRNQDFYKSAELYDPATGKFRPTGEMNERRVGHVAVLLHSGKVLIAGGWVAVGATDSAELYDPATGKFTAIGKMTTRRGRPSATLLENGDVLIAGGEDHDGRGAQLTSAEVFHAASRRFETTGSMRHARISHTATLLKDGRVLIAGGFANDVTASAELYDPNAGRFSETGNLLAGRCKHTAGLLADGRVLVAGGSADEGWHANLNSSEIYDPRTGKFSPGANLNDRRFKLPDEAVRLQSGRLLVAGGSKEAEIFDPISGKFAVVPGEMNDNWHYMSETLLRDGSVLLAGGYPNSDQATALAWIYRP